MKHKNNTEIAEWCKVAERDLQTAEILLQHGNLQIFDVVCFHCQQAAEKYLKALMIYFDKQPPRTHDLGFLMELISEEEKEIVLLKEIVKLNEFAVNYRYPDHLEIDDIEVAKESLEMVRKTKSFVLQIAEELKY